MKFHQQRDVGAHTPRFPKDMSAKVLRRVLLTLSVNLAPCERYFLTSHCECTGPADGRMFFFFPQYSRGRHLYLCGGIPDFGPHWKTKKEGMRGLVVQRKRGGWDDASEVKNDDHLR